MSADFRRQINAAKDKVDALQEKTVRLIALKTFGNIVLETPVGNPEIWKINRGKKRGDPGFVGANYIGGSAKQNWHIQLNIVDVSIVDPTGHEDENYDGREKALPVTAAYKLSDTIYISNNLPYIRPLNDGHSTQAPAGFVDAAIQRGVRQGMELAKK